MILIRAFCVSDSLPYVRLRALLSPPARLADVSGHWGCPKRGGVTLRIDDKKAEAAVAILLVLSHPEGMKSQRPNDVFACRVD